MAVPADFEQATGTVRGLVLRNTDLTGTNPPEDATFVECDFSGTKMDRLDLSGLVFENCKFQQTTLTHTILLGTQFIEGCNLEGASLEQAHAENAVLRGANLTTARAARGVFDGADFTGATLPEADFSGANLDRAVGFQPDRTRVRGATFSGGSADDWTNLRREYTGLNLFLAILPPLIYVAGILAKAYAASARAFFELVLAGARPVCGPEGILCTDVPVWRIILGFEEGLLAGGFVVFALTYNTVRLLLTKRVAHLAAIEDRTGTTPAIRGTAGYLFLSRIGFWVGLAKYVMLGLFAWNMFELLSHTVPVPVSAEG